MSICNNLEGLSILLWNMCPINEHSPVLTLFCYTFPFLGLGIGICLCAGVTVVAEHFDRYRGLAFGIVTAGGGLGTFIFPFLLDALNTNYGWRGTMLLMGGVLLHTCVFGSIMWPKDKNRLLTETSSARDAPKSFTELEIFHGLRANWRFLVLCISNFSFAFGFTIFFTHMPEYSRRDIGLNEYQMSVLVSCTGVANLVFRLLQGALLDLPCVDSQIIFTISYAGLGVVIACLPFAGTYEWMIVLSILFGAMFAAYGPALSEITLLYTGKEMYVSGYGYMTLVCGVGGVIGAPVAGNSHPLYHTILFTFIVFLYVCNTFTFSLIQWSC